VLQNAEARRPRPLALLLALLCEIGLILRSLLRLGQWHGHCQLATRRTSMKKVLGLIMVVAILAAAAAPSFAQRRKRSCNSSSQTYNSQASYDSRGYYDNSGVYDNSSVYYDYGYDNRSFWQKHRDKLMVAIGAGAGAALGSVFGGRRGAVIGAAAGAGSSALYTYKIRNRGYRY